MSMDSDFTLRDKQISTIEKMLLFNSENRNSDVTASIDDSEMIWKVLVLDTKTTAIISSILRVNDLLKSGVTVHSLIKQQRSPLPDVPVVYFVQPTEENIDLIVEDLNKNMYSEYYINFSSSLKRELLEDLAKKVATISKSSRIKQVYDQYTEFVVTEPELFSLDLNGTYALINNPQSSEDAIMQLCEKIADGLFNVILTVGNIPVIRAPRGGPAEMVAQKLESKLRDYVISTRSNNSNNALERFLLLILDRNIDLPTMLAHSWIYQCLVFDVFKLSRNTISVPSTDSQGQVTYKKMDIEPKDFFWNSNAHLPFPDAVENVESALSEYKLEAEEITKKTGVNNIDDLDPNSHNDTLQIQEAVDKLPQLTAKKNIIDTHMNVLAALLKELENKGLDSFFELEQMTDSTKFRQSYLEILKDGRTNNLEDKFRTLIILYLTAADALPNDFIKQVVDYFTSNNYDIKALNYVYKLRDIMKLSNMPLKAENGTHVHNTGSIGGNSAQLLSGLSNKFLGLTEGKIQGGVGSLISGIKKLLPEKKATPVTNVLASLMDPLNSSQSNLEVTDDYLYFDPRVMRGSHSQKPKRQSYNKSLVFVVGGGNYVEYQNLQEWAHQQGNSKKIVYGSTSITTPSDFLKEFEQIS
ncbi:HEL158Cp [Eremothecium sinecaudum]|uniref:HEL158Cp n=1 Tax=Eremothecium sinecaudum TaxID=45286 RepID=A0A109UZP5_9SACH|nr:HEL158Cp [Eremothecium sinecaudum]AMD21123.1 HEL158Cp [Eremothecium sinecaudum]